MILTLLRARDNSRVVIYTVHEPPAAPADLLDRAEQIVFVKEGFSWPAILLGPVWLAVNRLWLPLLAYLAAFLALAIGLKAMDVGEQWTSLVLLAAQVVFAFEADGLLIWALERKGWRQIGTVAGRNQSDCERRFLEKWLPTQTDVTSQTVADRSLLAGADEERHRSRRLLSGWRRPWGRLFGAEV